MTGSNNHYSLISLNINGLNAPIKRHSLTDWIRKQDPIFWVTSFLHFAFSLTVESMMLRDIKE